MKEEAVRVYVDTSVFGGISDAEFSAASNRFFDLVRQGRFVLVVSTTVVDELADAPEQVRALYASFGAISEHVPVTEPALELRDAYLRARIVSNRFTADALHVAVATVSECSLIVSWNFRHIVNFRKVPLYNAVNRANGHAELGIYTPQEVIEDEEEGI